MASGPRVEISSESAKAVVETASAFLTSERQASLFHADVLSVEAAGVRMGSNSYAGQKGAVPTIALVKALKMAHDEAHDPFFWPTPEEELEEYNRGKKQRGDSRDCGDRIRGGGGSGSGSGQAGGGGNNGGGGDHHHRRGGGSGGGRGGGASGVGGASGCRQGSSQGRNNRCGCPQIWGRHRRAAEHRDRTFSVGRLVHLVPLIPLVLGLEHGPRRADRRSGQKASDSFPGGWCFLRRAPEQTACVGRSH